MVKYEPVSINYISTILKDQGFCIYVTPFFEMLSVYACVCACACVYVYVCVWSNEHAPGPSSCAKTDVLPYNYHQLVARKRLRWTENERRTQTEKKRRRPFVYVKEMLCFNNPRDWHGTKTWWCFKGKAVKFDAHLHLQINPCLFLLWQVWDVIIRMPQWGVLPVERGVSISLVWTFPLFWSWQPEETACRADHTAG